MSETVTVTIDKHVAQVSLNRPEKRNAINHDMFEALIATGQQIAENPAVRAVVVTGAGGNFCAGIDLSVFQNGGLEAAAGNLMDPRGDSPANYFQAAGFVWRELPVPVIAAMSGVAFGGGLQIALGADLRIATPDAELSVMEVKWGIVPDMAITATAHHVVPVDKLKELAFTGRVVSGVVAERYGLVTSVADEPNAAALALAGEIAARSPDAVRAIKRLFDETWHGHTATALRHEAALQKQLVGQPNQVEAVMANMEKRAPRFRDA